MLITVTCPMCGAEAQIDEALLGKKLRCANPECRKSFRLTPDGTAIPLAEKVALEEANPDWMSNPPPAPGQERDWMTHPPGGAPMMQAELISPGHGQAAYAEPTFPGYGAGGESYGQYPRRRSRTRNLAIAFVFFSIVALGVGGWLVISRSADARKTMEQEAKKYLNEGDFSRAKRAYEELKQRYPDSKEQKVYDFYIQWCTIQNEVAAKTPQSLQAAQDQLTNFVRNHRGEELFKEENYRSKTWHTAMEIAEAAATEADRSANEGLLNTATAALSIAEDARTGEKDQEAAKKRHDAVQAKLNRAREAIAAVKARKEFLGKAKAVGEAQDSRALEDLQQQLAQLCDKYPRLKEDSELAAEMEKLQGEEPQWIRYVPTNQPPSKLPPSQMPPSVILCPPLVPGPANPPADTDPNRCVMALARGTLYGMTAWNGEPKWAMRVGVDVNQLPPLIPARRGEPDIALVISVEANNQNFISAVDVSTGERRWSRQLSDRAFGGVRLVGQRAYVPTRDGRLYVIGLDGRLIGYYEIGHPLSVLPAVDPVTNRLYQPADAKRIFVFNLANNTCEDILYTNHPAGGLRSPPVIVPPSPGDAGAAATLVIAEATGLGNMTLRAFSTRQRGAGLKPVREFQIPGWSWFAASFDGDTLSLVTDRGFLGLYGVNRGTKDDVLFQLSPRPLAITADVAAQGARGSDPSGPAQIVYVRMDEYWVLVDGRLYRRRFDLYRQQLVPSGGDPIELGNPLQQAVMSPDGRHLFLVTQERDRALATAIDRLTGTIAWQRQLGLVPAQDPLTMGNQVLTVDKSGALFVLDAASAPNAPRGSWLAVGTWPVGRVRGATIVRLAPLMDNSGVVLVAYVAATEQLVLRRFELGKGITAERTFRIPSPPHGTPAASPDGSVVIPCRDGNLREYFFSGSISASGAPLTWRDPLAPSGAQGHCAFISPNELMATDGNRKLLRWERTSDRRRWQKVDGDLAFSARIVTPIVACKVEDQPCILVGDETGRIYLSSTAGLPIQREWAGNGVISKGPFCLNSKFAGCVFDGRRLVWFDPAKEPNQEPLRQYEQTGGLIGAPLAINSLLAVPTLKAGYQWLDMQRQDPAAPPISLAAALVPAVGLAQLGSDRLFAPLSDGTALLLPLPANRSNSGADTN